MTGVTEHYTGLKVFSATHPSKREVLGEAVTQWLQQNPVTIVDTVVRQSSETNYHCLSILVFYK